MKEIPLGSGLNAKVDDEDYEENWQFWHEKTKPNKANFAALDAGMGA